MNKQSRGVIYLLTSQSYAVRLAVSLHSLRKYYSGPVTIFYAPEELISWVAKFQTETGVSTRPVTLKGCPEFLHYATKVSLPRLSPYDTTLFLDADTLVTGDIEEVWAESGEFVLTQYSNWTTFWPRIKSRLEFFRALDPEQTQHCLDVEYPAINTGVYSFHRDHPLVGAWEELVSEGAIEGIIDEIAMQLLVPKYPHRLLSDRFNCHPGRGLHKEDAVIWHYYGSRHLTNEAKKTWLRAYEEVIQDNYLGIQHWTPAEDALLATYLKGKASPPPIHPKFAQMRVLGD